ncbi:molybdopterin-dependent oxidoreductase [Nonomuraea africana]|uniref:DMSO/TMAO reductase YedYZ molybdopterin-dependent catalytic subunit n=1 Tax=Nonomuraea africana TaxID=46171 RepID=A0ABR9KRI7_9ACTN|nr:molybdopterin-dependent oxidoreductase [Nonomuraea africana]MBE1564638.1 DMSO/TMAO reductase YedYZ molybdopterin-dependent catalytic subunit [Nonomuraea africana]
MIPGISSSTGLLPNPSGFRYYSVAASVPRKTAADYRLEIGGLVERPGTYTLDELRALRRGAVQCASKSPVKMVM